MNANTQETTDRQDEVDAGRVTGGAKNQGPVVTVNMDIQYAQAMASALDVFVRLGLGQVRELSQLFRTGLLPMKKMDRSPDQMDKDRDEVDNAVKALSVALGFSSGESYGLGNQGVSGKVHAAYELMKVLNKALAEYRNPNPEFKGVDYDGLTVR